MAYFKASLRTERLDSMIDIYVVPFLISPDETDCIESRVSIFWSFEAVFWEMVSAILLSFPSIVKMAVRAYSSTFFARKVIVSKLASDSAEHPTNAA